jgi:hypothetical protein
LLSRRLQIVKLNICVSTANVSNQESEHLDAADSSQHWVDAYNHLCQYSQRSQRIYANLTLFGA